MQVTIGPWYITRSGSLASCEVLHRWCGREGVPSGVFVIRTLLQLHVLCRGFVAQDAMQPVAADADCCTTVVAMAQIIDERMLPWHAGCGQSRVATMRRLLWFVGCCGACKGEAGQPWLSDRRSACLGNARCAQLAVVQKCAWSGVDGSRMSTQTSIAAETMAVVMQVAHVVRTLVAAETVLVAGLLVSMALACSLLGCAVGFDMPLATIRWLLRKAQGRLRLVCRGGASLAS